LGFGIEVEIEIEILLKFLVFRALLLEGWNESFLLLWCIFREIASQSTKVGRDVPDPPFRGHVQIKEIAKKILYILNYKHGTRR
jgi:hypothetical protein